MPIQVYNSAMSGAINQMQLSYEPEEDRILFRVNTLQTEEFRFWITRRFAFLWLKILQDHLERDPDVSVQATPEGREAVKEFKKEQAEQSADFTQKFSPLASAFPLGEEALLAYKLSFAYKGNMMNLTIEPKEGKGISLMLNRELNVSLTRLLLAAGEKADWKIKESEWYREADSKENGEKKIIN